MRKALVIDDNSLFRESAKDLLSELGFEVFEAEGPESALELCDANSMQLILCDLIMPSGVAADEVAEDFEDEALDGSAMVGAHTIRRLSKSFPKVPIIAMSGVIEESMLRAFSSLGATEALKKPFTIEELAQAVERACHTVTRLEQR